MAFDGLRLALGTLTVLPSGPVGEIRRPVAGRAMLLAPVAVLPVAVVAAGVGWVAGRAGLPALAAGLLTVGMLALGSRALHLDGLADTVDGLGAGWDRERSLAIMQRGNTGPMGVTALIVLLGLQAATIGALLQTPSGALVAVLAVCASRAALVLTCRRGVPAARPTGLGVAVAGSVPTLAAALSWVAVAVVVTLLPHPGLVDLGGLAGAVLAAAAVLALVRRCVRRLGGVTGDVMGAAVEIALTCLLLGLAAR